MNEFNEYFKFVFIVDNVIFGFDEGDLKVLFIKCGEEFYYGKWGLLGYFVYFNEDFDMVVKWVLEELIGLCNVFLE